MVDRNNNEITRIGRYGNMDSAGPNSAIPTPEIAFAWPMNVSAGERYLYVSDVYNDRIVRTKLEYRKSAEKSFSYNK